MRQRTTLQSFLSEVIFFAGIPLRRGDVLRHLSARDDLPAKFGADYQACKPEAVTGIEPWTLAAFEAMVAACEEKGASV